jgi:F0F1-type ATP synthase delta subunit
MQLAQERGELEAVREDMHVGGRYLRQQPRPAQLLLNSPVVKADKKEKVLGRLLRRARSAAMTERFINVLVRKGRESHCCRKRPRPSKKLTASDKNILLPKLKALLPLNDAARAEVKRWRNNAIPANPSSCGDGGPRPDRWLGECASAMSSWTVASAVP